MPAPSARDPHDGLRRPGVGHRGDAAGRLRLSRQALQARGGDGGGEPRLRGSPAASRERAAARRGRAAPGARAALGALEGHAGDREPVRGGGLERRRRCSLGRERDGEELVAQAIHWASPRRGGRFLAVNCAAVPETLLESELFGHEKGAFTGADRRREGLFAAANGGTLFLDEIGDMPVATQAKLLRVLQDRAVRPLGGTASLQLDLRVVAATNKELAPMIKDGRFREDLYYRLAVIPIRLPSLRERPEDIMLIGEHYLRETADRLGKHVE